MCSYELAAAAVIAVAGGVSSADQSRRSSHQSAEATAAANAANSAVSPTAQAYTSPEADPSAQQPMTRQRLKVDLNSSLAPKRAGSGLQVTTPGVGVNTSGTNVAPYIGVRG